MKTLETLEQMFLVYIRSEEFGTLTSEGRNDAVNAYEELKALAVNSEK